MDLEHHRTRAILSLPQSSLCLLESLGSNILLAIKKRGLRRKDIAQRAQLSEPTLRAIVRGDPKVSIGCYLAVLAVLGQDGAIAQVADPGNDEVGNALAARRLPERVRNPPSRYDF